MNAWSKTQQASHTFSARHAWSCVLACQFFTLGQDIEYVRVVEPCSTLGCCAISPRSFTLDLEVPTSETLQQKFVCEEVFPTRCPNCVCELDSHSIIAISERGMSSSCTMLSEELAQEQRSTQRIVEEELVGAVSIVSKYRQEST
ncbi:MAG: hypothetical protein C4326_10530 [Ignavibacteria bacterium]